MLAGHHDRVRRADRRGADRRLRRVRRRDARARSRSRASRARSRGERMRAWDVVWGDGTRDVVIENSYVDVDERASSPPATSEIDADGLFSLGYPRKDGGEEINARVRDDATAARRPAARLRLDDYPVDGAAVRRVPPLRRVRDAVRLRHA